MTSKSSLEELLQKLVNFSDAHKSALMYALLKALKEACNIEGSGNGSRAGDIIDGILSGSSQAEEEEWEEEFAESNPDFGAFEEAETFTSSESVIDVHEDSSSPSGQLKMKIAAWNKSMEPWMKLPQVEIEKNASVAEFVKAAAALRCDLSSSVDNSKELQKFVEFWEQCLTILVGAGYEFSGPTRFGMLTSPIGKVIHTCRSRITETETELIVPGVKYQGQQLITPVSLVTLPVDASYPADHINAPLASHWRGIFGELDLLSQLVEIQYHASCAIEGVNKNRVEPLKEARESVLNEINRRAEVLRATIHKEDETLYRLATDYWRVEECFWSIFHDDERSANSSYFDRLRNRLQAWRAPLRRATKFHIRDFACGSDTLASVNKYIGNIILRPKRNITPGMVIRELRPAILVKVQATSRLLKGRVIAT